jgi:hypothetical protein
VSDERRYLSEDEFLASVELKGPPTAWTPADEMELDKGTASAEPDHHPEGADPTVTFTEFVARQDETSREPLITTEQGTVLPAGGLALLGATTSHGKTTWAVELVQHACAGRDYVGLHFTRPLGVLVIENEGPRDAFREKLGGRLANWEHNGEPRIWDVPEDWGQVRVSSPTIRERLREAVERHQIDLVVSDSLTRFGVKGNGTPEETRDFIELLTELGLGRDLAFLLLAHPRTRGDPGEDELERIAGAWVPHADLVMLLKKLDGNRARLSFPKTRWTRGPRPPSILAFDPDTGSFTYVGDDVPVDRDYVSEVRELMEAKREKEWWTVTDLRAPKKAGGIGARKEAVESGLTDECFEKVDGAAIGKTKGHDYYRLSNVTNPPVTLVTLDRSALETGRTSPSPPIEGVVGGDVRYERDEAGEVARIVRAASPAGDGLSSAELRERSGLDGDRLIAAVDRAEARGVLGTFTVPGPNGPEVRYRATVDQAEVERLASRAREFEEDG